MNMTGPNNNKEPVPYCDFRTGLTYADVYYMIWSRKWKRRKGVLGKWCQIKREMYAEYLYEFYKTQEMEHVKNESRNCAVRRRNRHPTESR